MKDEEFFKLLKTDIPAAFRWLVKTYQQKLYWQIRKIVLDHEDANDVLQNVMMKVYENLHGFRRDAQLSTWLYRICYNESINFLRNVARKKSESIEYHIQSVANQLADDPLFDGDEAALKLQQAVAKLPHRQSMIFKYRYYDELKFKEIAEIMGIDEGGVRSGYFHAVSKIKKWIE